MTSECKQGKSESNADKGVWSSAKLGRAIGTWSEGCANCAEFSLFCVLTTEKNCNSLLQQTVRGVNSMDQTLTWCAEWRIPIDHKLDVISIHNAP